MKNFIFGILILTGYMGADAHAEVAPTIYGDAWTEACTIVEGGCVGVPTPTVVWVAKWSSITKAVIGGYASDTGTVYLQAGMEDEKVYGVLIHEYTHHILHYNGTVVMTHARSICRSEQKAFRVTNRWLRDNDLRHLIVHNWKFSYPQCQ